MNESCSCKLNTVSDHRQLVFVYGTLKRGGSNHHWLAQAIYMGEGISCERYALYQGADPWPYMVEDQTCYPVQGELYAVMQNELALLDELEECPQLYVRKQIGVQMATGAVIQPWAYFSVHTEGSLLVAGCWDINSWQV